MGLEFWLRFVACMTTRRYAFSSAGWANSIASQKLCVLCLAQITAARRHVETCDPARTDLLTNSAHKPITSSLCPRAKELKKTTDEKLT